ncbi:hypothetical protein J6590_087499 [Homalodisca vitripennis]|nr:hypothetical protein J6590_087499 [Homalodisca vitripennis]
MSTGLGQTLSGTLVLVACFLVFAISICWVSWAKHPADTKPAQPMDRREKHEVSVSTETACNVVTGSPLILIDDTGDARQACRCHWPTLFGQKDLFSDCDVHRACDGGIGTLVHKGVPPVNIHDYECSACDRCNVPGTDPHTGLPSCLPVPFNERERDMCVYDVKSEYDVYNDDEHADDTVADHRTTKTMLSVRSRFVDTRFFSMFVDRVRDTAWIPNPCSFDLFTGADLQGGCELRMTRKSNTAYCAPLQDNFMTAIKDDSYLANNSGQFPNACFRFTSNEEHVNGYVMEYFVRERRGLDLPAPVVSMRIEKKYVLNSVLGGLGLGREREAKMLLFTQPEPPSDVSEFPHPFNARRMADFKKELNHWRDELPSKCIAHYKTLIVYNCSAPVQPLEIPKCSSVGEPFGFLQNANKIPTGLFGDAEEYAKSAVACLEPDYDARFPIVPNYNVRPGSTNADPSSAILFYDKTNNTVYPHWKDVGDKVSTEIGTIQRYVREKLRSLPNDA